MILKLIGVPEDKQEIWIEELTLVVDIPRGKKEQIEM
jgi:hypothetical protein